MTATDLCTALVRIPTDAPHPTGPAIDLCLEVLAPARFHLAHRFETAPGIEHALLERDGEGPPLLFDGHLDTVPPGEGWQREPLAAEVADGKLWGRGATDDKGPLAAVIAALAAGRYRRHVLLSLSGDEELHMRGLRALCTHPLVRATSQAVVIEPTDLVPVCAHKGNSRLRVDVAGRAAHASKPWEGENAVENKLRLIEAVQSRWAAGEGQRRLELFGDEPATLVVTREETPNPTYNVVPDRASYWYNYRPLPGPADPFGDLTKIILEEAARLGVHASVESEFEVAPFLADCGSPLLQALSQAGGRQPEWVPYGTHAGPLSTVVPQVAVFGPGRIEQAHVPNEFITLAELERAVGVFQGLLEVSP